MTQARAKVTPEEALAYHKGKLTSGKLEVLPKTSLKNFKELSLAYTPGVAEPCKEIFKNPERVHDYTFKDNCVAIVSDGTAVLGLGDIGAEAALPVMEGKAVLFKTFAGVDAFPICLKTKVPEKIVESVRLLEPSFGGINLEDISAPRCFEIEEKLKQSLSIPVFHDDQDGTAVVTLAGLLNALKITGKKISEIKIVINGAGAAGITCAKFYMNAGAKELILCDTLGIIYEGRKEGMNPFKEEIARLTNKSKLHGTLAHALKGADVFIGVSAASIVSEEMVSSMQKNAIVFACANPIPEIMPEKAKKAGAKIIATGRSDYPNQVNNVLGFPAIFRGALDVRAKDINEEMKIAASYTIANSISEKELSENYIIPSPFNIGMYAEEAEAVARAAIKSGVAVIKRKKGEVAERTRKLCLLKNTS